MNKNKERYSFSGDANQNLYQHKTSYGQAYRPVRLLAGEQACR